MGLIEGEIIIGDGMLMHKPYVQTWRWRLLIHELLSYELLNSFHHHSTLYSDIGTQQADCTDGDVRLVGSQPGSGRVEVCLNRAWGSVCRNSFQPAEVIVVCRQLAGFTAGLSKTTRCVPWLCGAYCIQNLQVLRC